MMKQTTFDDEYYVVRAQKGDREALEQLFKKYHNLAFYIALKLCHCDADAEDIVQESFIEIERSISNIHEPKYFKAWLNRVIFSKSTKLFRRNKDVNLSDDAYIKMKQNKEDRLYLLPEEQMKFQNDREVLLHFLQCLPDKLRSCLYMMYFEQMSVKEIAYALDIPEGTVKSRVSNAKAELKTMIVNYEKREHVKLDFHCVTLEGALAVVLMHEYEQVCGSALTTAIHFEGANRVLKRIPKSVSLLGGVCVLSSVLVGGGILTEYHNQQDHDTVALQSYHTFEPITFQGETLYTAREAYETLVNTAHCSYEIEQLDERMQDELKQVYVSLKKNGGVYYGLLYQRQYAEMFE